MKKKLIIGGVFTLISVMSVFAYLVFQGIFIPNQISADKYEIKGVDVAKELLVMVEMLEKHYSKKVILYATQEAYDLYIKDAYPQCDIWIRSVFTKPSLSDERKWTFWQYTNRGRLNGYNGKEKYIDLNVFYGNEEEFENYGIKG
ncbi:MULTISPECIES: GH25 family lysozyme [unclassified Bacillus cereus group]|uniref:GH25 family lysozyme n=1 Tax=unclassified Bacillus cereus group TaxID=2750818 RepID=UPI0033953744